MTETEAFEAMPAHYQSLPDGAGRPVVALCTATAIGAADEASWPKRYCLMPRSRHLLFRLVEHLCRPRGKRLELSPTGTKADPGMH
jgi:hypothetical protein